MNDIVEQDIKVGHILIDKRYEEWELWYLKVITSISFICATTLGPSITYKYVADQSRDGGMISMTTLMVLLENGLMVYK